MVDDPKGQATKWDEKVPTGLSGEREIGDHMDTEYGHVLPKDYIDAVAPHVSDLREEEEGPGMGTGSDGYYDPDVGQWRDPDTGAFISGPDG